MASSLKTVNSSVCGGIPPALSLARARARARPRPRHSSHVSLAQDVVLTGLVVVSLPGSFRAAAQSLAFLPQ